MPRFFKEGEIAFAPTFKRKAYDNTTFKMKRNPAWTDRILYHCGQVDTLELCAYDSNNLVNLSDHRPVFAQFLFKIDLENGESEAEEVKSQSGVSNISKKSNISRLSRAATKRMTE